MEGNLAVAMAAAREAAGLAPVGNVVALPPLEVYLPVPLYVLARCGRWTEILREPAPPAPLRFTGGVWHYARALAQAASGSYDSARAEADSLTVIADEYSAQAIVGLNSGRALLQIASHVLEGELAARGATRIEEALDHFQQAIRIEDRLTYDEPPPWYYPVRPSLGAVLLAARRAREAEAAYREDLRRHPRMAGRWSGCAKRCWHRGNAPMRRRSTRGSSGPGRAPT